MMFLKGRQVGLLAFSLVISSTWGNVSFPSLDLVVETLITTAQLDFDGNPKSLEAASTWTAHRLQDDRKSKGVYVACADYSRRSEAVSTLRSHFDPSAVRPVSWTPTHGACYMVTCSYSEYEELISTEHLWTSLGPFPSALKVAPGLLEHQDCGSSAGRLCTTHGPSMLPDNVHGLTVELSPGTLLDHDPRADLFLGDLTNGMVSNAMDLFSMNFWSDSIREGDEHLDHPAGAVRGREWSRAATVVHELSDAGQTSPGDICSFGNVGIHQATQDVLLVSGLDHLLYNGRGLGGANDEEATELQVACLMGLLSFFASRSEVLRITPWNAKRPHNAAARANIQSASVTSTPLTDVGLDGSGQVIQIVDSGLNETSCFFAHGDGSDVEHGHYFEHIGTSNPSFTSSSTSFSLFRPIFEGGDFTYDSNRRKVIQYIDLVDSDPESSEESGYTSENGGFFPFIDPEVFNADDSVGHGMHVAGSAAGSTPTTPATLITCGTDEVMGCAGRCLPENDTIPSDDLGIDYLCEAFGCVGGFVDTQCLSNDVETTVSDNGGIAQGAKLAMIDVFWNQFGYGDLAGKGVFEASMGAGAKIHSNSYGVDTRCDIESFDLVNDKFMYDNPENLLIFSAGNDGWATDRDGLCTIESPAIGKNCLSIGSSSSGETRLTGTNIESESLNDDDDEVVGDIDTISSFSGYGPTTDGRIKPEVLAPGDEIYSAAGSYGEGDSCRIAAYAGTSMATAVAAGSAALVRQYLQDSEFYAADVKARGFCDDGFVCEGFSANAATVKAMLINSANLMGQGTEPLPFRGFGRIHLEAGMPLDGEGSMALYVENDSELESDKSRTVYFEVDASADLDLRATVSWIDVPATSVSATQLVNDLDLRVIAPDGDKFYMWADNKWDVRNVNERVIVTADEVAQKGSGLWGVRVRSRELTTDTQHYSLVVTGAISPASSSSADATTVEDVAAMAVTSGADDDDSESTNAAAGSTATFGPFLLAAVSSLTVLALALV